MPGNALGSSALASIDSSCTIILVGESHYSFGNDEIQLQLFKQLVLTKNVRALLLECGMGSAYVINKYLATGDKTLWHIEPYYTTNKFFLDSLRSFQQQLSKENKFTVYGVDYEKNVDALSWALQDLLLESNIADSIKLLPANCGSFILQFLSDNNVEFKTRRKALQNLDSLLNVYDQSKEIFLDILGTKFVQFRDIIENYRASKPMYAMNFEDSNCPLGQERERLFYRNIISIRSEGRLFGQFGIVHVNLEKQETWWNKKNGWYSFSAMLNSENDSPYREKVCCIEMVYPHFDKRRSWKKDKTLGFSKSVMAQIFSTCSKGDWCLISTKELDKNIYERKYQYLLVNRVFEK